MTLGAQLFSVRTHTQTPDDLRKTFQKIREIGYENVQLSGAGPIDAQVIREICEETQLPIVCTHVSWDRIIGDTDNVIREHRIFGSPVIGLGTMPKEMRDSREGLDAFLDAMREPVKRIRDAGLAFAYHNHAFEFQPLSDSGDIAYDILLESCPDWQFIMDTYWVEFAGRSAVEYIRKIGGERLPNIHFKDMARTEERGICACGDGCLNFAEIYRVCLETGVKHVLVEQDNAVKAPDAFAEMQKSFAHLRPIIV